MSDTTHNTLKIFTLEKFVEALDSECVPFLIFKAKNSLADNTSSLPAAMLYRFSGMRKSMAAESEWVRKSWLDHVDGLIKGFAKPLPFAFQRFSFF